ncbi:hypothetical protein N9Y92_03345, partial [Chlamydiales bacterium]|nr:hypothetical protein [Chlamydiales bacterium]
DSSSEILFNVFFYEEGYVITQVTGVEKGKQIVVYEERIIGLSFSKDQDGRGLYNEYPWGAIITYSDFQLVDGLNQGI